MATRYSGSLILTLRYVDATESYTVRIREQNDDARFETLTGIKLAPYFAAQMAVDCPRAYDLAAEAALGFASNDDDAIAVYACETSNDSPGTWHVGRRKEHRSPAPWL